MSDQIAVVEVTLNKGQNASLKQVGQFTGYRGDANNPSLILFRNNSLHIELHIDRNHPVGKAHAAGIKDVILEAAVTTIQDLEDSVAAVDAEDKTLAYGLGSDHGIRRSEFASCGVGV